MLLIQQMKDYTDSIGSYDSVVIAEDNATQGNFLIHAVEQCSWYVWTHSH